MRLVLDTNVVASALLWTGSPFRILDAALAGEVELFTSRFLLAELARILARAKFANAIAASGLSRDELVLGYSEVAALLEPAPIAPVILRDPEDDQVLACAISAAADLIVSGDRDLLDLQTYQSIPILNPAEAVRRITAT